jgi:hypothetical protein
MESQSNAQPDNPFVRDEDFVSLYSNNVQLEQSAWDLKLIFGQLDQSSGKAVVEQHTAMTIPWAQVKLLAYFLELQVGSYEAEYGTIRIHPSIRPPLPDASQVDPQNTLAQALVNHFVHRHRWFFGDSAPTSESSTEPPSPPEPEKK